MFRLLLTATFLLNFLVNPADVESQEQEEAYYDEGEELSDFDFLRENVFNLTEQERFCLNISEQINATKHRGFLHGFCIKLSSVSVRWSALIFSAESVTVILVSEIGDKTFFIAAIM